MKKIVLGGLTVLCASTTAYSSNCYLYTKSESLVIPGYVDPSQASGGETDPATFRNWKGAVIEDHPASDFGPPQIGGVEGSDLVYIGPSDSRALLSGLPRSWPVASKVKIDSKLFFSSKWSPTGKEFCSKHKTKRNQARVCVEKQIAYDPTYVTAQLVVDGETVVFEKRLTNLNSFVNTDMKFPTLECIGPVAGFEIRIRNFEGGTANFRIHRVIIDPGYLL